MLKRDDTLLVLFISTNLLAILFLVIVFSSSFSQFSNLLKLGFGLLWVILLLVRILLNRKYGTVKSVVRLMSMKSRQLVFAGITCLMMIAGCLRLLSDMAVYQRVIGAVAMVVGFVLTVGLLWGIKYACMCDKVNN